MFDNKKVKATGIHFSRYIASWRNSGGKYFNEYFEEWLKSEGATDDEIMEIREMAKCGKMELEMSAKNFIAAQKGEKI